VRVLAPGRRLSLAARSLLTQGSWNYRTLIGTGFAFLLLPSLRRIHPSEEALGEATRRHAELFNSHPYFTPVAAGAVLRLEEDGTDPAMIRRFKDAVRGPLGAIGDQLIWRSWRPAALLLGMALLLAGAPWWLAVGAFLLAYNALHLWLRVWGVEVGYRAGLDLGSALRSVDFTRLARRASGVGAVLCGFCAALLTMNAVRAGGTERPVALALGALAAGAVAMGLHLGPRARRAGWLAIALAWVGFSLSAIAS
jgi:mannose PTS system EIID component